MAHRDLIPETRPDKNGNIVTRWVKRMFAAPEPVRNIPAPRLGIGPRAADREMMEMSDRIIKPVHKRTIDSSVAADDSLDATIVSRHKRQLEHISPHGDMDKIRLVSQYSQNFSPSIVSGLLDHLREDHSQAADMVNEERLSAYASFHEAVGRGKTPVNGEWSSDTVHRENLWKVGRYLLNNLDDGPQINEIVSRGITDYDGVMSMLATFKESSVPTVISDGVL